MPSRPNLAQRAARWSAEHRRVAIFGWIALVIACVLIGGALGTQHLADEDLGTGESRQADQIWLRPGSISVRARRCSSSRANPG